jgi:hypothetical protein
MRIYDTAARLTTGHSDDLEARIFQTHAGQAHLAGTGPPGTKCRDCAHYGYHAKVYTKSGDIAKTVRRDNACAKFRAITGKDGPSFRRDAASCKYFERRK